MLKLAKIPFFSWGLALLTLLVLFSNRPIVPDISLWLFFTALIALLLNLGSTQNEGILTPALTAALMAYLTLDHRSDALWSVAVGALIGSLVWAGRIIPLHRNYTHILRNITIATAQLTLSVYVGSCLYKWLDGQTPLMHLQGSDILPLTVLVLSYLVVYLEVLALEIRFYRYQESHTLIQHWHTLAGITVIPLPFAVLGAVVYHQLSSLAFALLVMGLLIVVSGVHLINRTQLRSRQQVRELSALSVVSRAMRTNQDLNSVLDVVYQQLARLLQMPNLTVALIDSGRNQLYFPLNIEGHHQSALPPRELGDGLIEYVIRQKTSLLISEHVPQGARALELTPPPMPVYSWMAVPLLAPERVLGCLAVYSSNPAHLYTKNDLRLLATLAGQVGIAIDNAQLYGQARDRSMQLSTLNNVANILSGTLDVQQMLDLTGSSAIAVANCDAVALYVWWDGTQRPLTLARQNGLSAEFTANPIQPIMLSLDDLHRRRQPMIITDILIDHRAAHLRPVMGANKTAPGSSFCCARAKI